MSLLSLNLYNTLILEKISASKTLFFKSNVTKHDFDENNLFRIYILNDYFLLKKKYLENWFIQKEYIGEKNNLLISQYYHIELKKIFFLWKYNQFFLLFQNFNFIYNNQEKICMFVHFITMKNTDNFLLINNVVKIIDLNKNFFFSLRHYLFCHKLYHKKFFYKKKLLNTWCVKDKFKTSFTTLMKWSHFLKIFSKIFIKLVPEYNILSLKKKSNLFNFLQLQQVWFSNLKINFYFEFLNQIQSFFFYLFIKYLKKCIKQKNLWYITKSPYDDIFFESFFFYCYFYLLYKINNYLTLFQKQFFFFNWYIQNFNNFFLLNFSIKFFTKYTFKKINLRKKNK